MRQFNCSRCDFAIFAPDDQEFVFCPNCNTREPVPDSAVVIQTPKLKPRLPDVTPSEAFAAGIENAAESTAKAAWFVGRTYILMLVAGYVVIIAGLLSVPVRLYYWFVITSEALRYANSNISFEAAVIEPVLIVATGVVVAGLGQMILSIRDIAIRIRHG